MARPLFQSLLCITWKSSNLSISRTPNPIHLAVNCSSLYRGTPQIKSFLTQDKSFCAPMPQLKNNLTSLKLQKTSTQHALGNQSFCCVCKQNLGATWSHMPRPLKFLIPPLSLAPMQRRPSCLTSWHLEAATEHQKHRDLPLVDQGKAEAHFRNRNSNPVGVKQQLKHSAARQGQVFIVSVGAGVGAG